VLVGPRTGASERTSPASLRGHATGLRLVGECFLLLADGKNLTKAPICQRKLVQTLMFLTTVK